MTFTLYLIPRNPRKIISHILGYHGKKKKEKSLHLLLWKIRRKTFYHFPHIFLIIIFSYFVFMVFEHEKVILLIIFPFLPFFRNQPYAKRNFGVISII